MQIHQVFILDATITFCVAVKNWPKTTIICMFSFTRQRISHISQSREQDEILRKILHISYIEQFVMPPKYDYLIGEKDVDFEEWQAGHPWIHEWPAIAEPSVDVGPPIDGLDSPLPRTEP